MKISRVVCLLFALVCAIPVFAQSSSKIEVDYNNPKTYIVGGVDVEGNEHFAPQQILQITGLQKGMEVKVPSEELSSIVNRLWMQRFFEDVAVVVDSLVALWYPFVLVSLVLLVSPFSSSPCYQLPPSLF